MEHVVPAVIFLFASLVASFLNVIIYRLPRNKSIVFPGSHCTTCGTPIPWYYNIPIVSYIFLRGKSKCCGTRIPVRYLLVEVLFPLLVVASYYKNGSSFGVTFFLDILFIACILVTAFIDFEHMIVYDALTVYPGVLILIVLTLTRLYVPVLNIAGALFGIIIVFLMNKLYMAVRHKKGMGEGDATTLFLIGSHLGLHGAVIALMVGSTLASIMGLLLYRDRDKAFAFCPYLCIGGLLALFLGDRIVSWYLSLF